jgi:fluoride exporter
MGNLLLVCLGGGAGSGARYLLANWVNERSGSAFAWGTLAVNVLGSFALAFLVQLASTSASFSPQLRLALTTGFLGGFTTYSTFNQDTLAAWQRGEHGLAALNVFATVVVCLAAGLGGQAAARALA